jgi:hypothetical protein
MTYDFGIGVVLTVMTFAVAGAATAAPPTATPSPGYDARLQEQHTAMQRSATRRHPVPRPHARRHTTARAKEH